MDQMSIGRLLRGNCIQVSPQEVSIVRGGGGRWGEGPGRRGKGGEGFERGPGREVFERGGRVLGNEQSVRQEVSLIIVAFPISNMNEDNDCHSQTVDNVILVITILSE